MEQYLLRKYGNRLDLHVQDYASNAHRWSQQNLPVNRIYSAYALAENRRYDLIYLSALDYALQDDDLIDLLATALSWLLPNGKVVMISDSFVDETRMETTLSTGKETTKAAVEHLGFSTLANFGVIPLTTGVSGHCGTCMLRFYQ